MITPPLHYNPPLVYPSVQLSPIFSFVYVYIFSRIYLIGDCYLYYLCKIRIGSPRLLSTKYVPMCVCLYVYLLFYVQFKNCSLIGRHHHYRWRAVKCRPMLDAHGVWAGRGSSSCHTCCDCSGLIRMTTPFCRLLRYTSGSGGPILTRILTGHLDIVNYKIKWKYLLNATINALHYLLENVIDYIFIVYNYRLFRISVVILGLNYHQRRNQRPLPCLIFLYVHYLKEVGSWAFQFYCAGCHNLLLNGSIPIPLVQTYCTCLTNFNPGSKKCASSNFNTVL
jgi:hypothetical protein